MDVATINSYKEYMNEVYPEKQEAYKKYQAVVIATEEAYQTMKKCWEDCDREKRSAKQAVLKQDSIMARYHMEESKRYRLEAEYAQIEFDGKKRERKAAKEEFQKLNNEFKRRKKLFNDAIKEFRLQA